MSGDPSDVRCQVRCPPLLFEPGSKVLSFTPKSTEKKMDESGPIILAAIMIDAALMSHAGLA